MRLIEEKHFRIYHALIGERIPDLIEKFNFKAGSIDLPYHTEVSAILSSNIEGNSIDINSFMNYKLHHIELNSHDDIIEIENLAGAYRFAQENRLNEKNILESHRILFKGLRKSIDYGKYRNEKIGVFGETGLMYLATDPSMLNVELTNFYIDLENLLKMKMSTAQVFYYASIIHLVFVHIHPMRDGNGRLARLLEKWFIASKLGSEFWKLLPEKYYKNHVEEYSQNINLGPKYEELNYDRCISFLLMLPNSLES